MRRRRTITCLAAAVFGVASAVGAGGLITVDEALASAFPGARAGRRTMFLTEEQRTAAARLAGVELRSRMVTRYRLERDGALAGWAYLDTHRVRTLPETLLVMLDSAGAVHRVEVVAFREPREYLPPARWYAQMDGRTLDRELGLKRGVRPITGATLSARAAVDAVRRVLALHRVLTESEDAR